MSSAVVKKPSGDCASQLEPSCALQAKCGTTPNRIKLPAEMTVTYSKFRDEQTFAFFFGGLN